MNMNKFDKFLMELSKKQDRGKISRNITIDYELDQILKGMDNLNVSELINKFLWHYVKREEGGTNDAKRM